MGSITFKTGNNKEYHLEIEEMNSNLLSAGSPGRVHKIADYLQNPEVEEGSRGLTVVHGEYEGIKISAFPTGMGPASASITIPEAIETTEDPVTLLRLGTAGSLQSKVKTGDIVIPSGAIRDESTTESVIGPEYPSLTDPAIIPLLVGAAGKHGYSMGENLWNGIIHVKDDLYFKETPHNSPSREIKEPRLKSYSRMGALSSSMEFSVYTILRDFYNIQKGRNISVGAVLGIIARKGRDDIEVKEDTKKNLEEDLIKIGMDCLLLDHRIRKGRKTEVNFEGIVRALLKTNI